MDFPPVETAMAEPNGLLMAGGDLSPASLIAAYQRGIFPWFDQDQPILWWSPDPRAVLIAERFRPSRSLRKNMRREAYGLSVNQAFAEVVNACASEHRSNGTWITAEMQQAYTALHQLGYAHSIEVWSGEVLIGGLYGVAVNKVFSAESMFHRQTDASKMALAACCKQMLVVGAQILDCQVENTHLTSLGAVTMPRSEYITALAESAPLSPSAQQWQNMPWNNTRELAVSFS